MLPHRFWSPPPLEAGPMRLEGPEAHHLSHVLRLATGDAVELFDGQGARGAATVFSVSRRSAEVVVSDVVHEPRTGPLTVLAVAPPKGERFDWLVEKAAELGVARLVPLITERGSVDPRDSKLSRLRQVVIAACKQSRSNWAMEIAATRSWNDFLRDVGNDTQLLIADPTGSPAVMERPARVSAPSEIMFAIGPEGGWTPSELASGAAAGGQRLSLGATILRIETAALVCATLGRIWSLRS